MVLVSLKESNSFFVLKILLSVYARDRCFSSKYIFYAFFFFVNNVQLQSIQEWTKQFSL